MKDIYVLVAILVVALFFRLYNLDSVPPLYHDEAMNGNDVIWAMDAGSYPEIFYPNNNGREGLFINIQGIFIKIFGNKVLALRLPSVIFGTLTILGLYFLARELFNQHVAYFSSFLLAISFWHVNFSRIGFRAIMLPFILVFEFYYLYKGLKFRKLKYFLYAGIFAGLGAYTYISYRSSPLILIILFASYWLYLKKDFWPRYSKGFFVLVVAAMVIAAPLLVFFFNHPGEFVGRTGTEISIFEKPHFLYNFFANMIKTLGMFNFSGDFIWRHNISRSPQLFWPVGILFLVGFVKELFCWLKIKKGYSLAHIFLFSWFFVMLLPGIFSLPAPHAVRTIGVIPVVMIFAGNGLLFFYNKINYKLAPVILIIFLSVIGFVEFWRYQVVWGKNIYVMDDFKQNYTNIADYAEKLPQNIPKYIVVNVSGVLVPIPDDLKKRSIPMPSQTVMFLTDSFSYQKQVRENLFYLTADEFNNLAPIDYRDAIVVRLESKEDRKTYSPVILSNSSRKNSTPKTIFILMESI